ncbi:MAG: hypothetical protein C4346_00300 [Chloroflexota bacterium]
MQIPGGVRASKPVGPRSALPELTRHLRGAEVYRPDPSAALRPPRLTRWLEPAGEERVEARPSPYAERVPPFARRPRRTGLTSPWTVKLGGILLATIALVAVGMERLPFLTRQGTPPPASTVAPMALGGMQPAPATPEPTSTPTPTPSPSPPPTPRPTPTPNPRYVGKVVCLDPGHGGSDRGYVRQANEVAPAMEEAHYNLAFARALQIRLEQHGFTVVLTRSTDTDVNADGRDVNGDGLTRANARTPAEAKRAGDVDELQARINICNAAHADLLVSMHINGFDDPSVNGYETWFSSARPFKDRNKLFATLAFEELGKQMAAAGYYATPRRVFDDVEANVDLGRDAFDRYIIIGPAVPGQIVPSAMPGAIVEVLFISNDEDAAFLASDTGRNAIVTAYERAITRYFDAISSGPSNGNPASSEADQ